MPPLSHACLDDWKKMGFSYQLWTEDNAQVRSWIDNCEFAKECYDHKLFAFVSDYLRLKVLQKEGGLYLDTDVTIRRDPFPLFSGKSFVVGFETEECLGTAAIYAEPESEILAELIEFYEGRIWSSPLYIGPQILTDVIKQGNFQSLESCLLLPRKYFYPYQQEAMDGYCLSESYLVHWFQHSWKQAPGMVFLKSKYLGFWGRLYTWQKYFFRSFPWG